MYSQDAKCTTSSAAESVRESAADTCLKKVYRIKDRVESLRDLTNKLNSIRLDLPVNPNTKGSECQRAMPPYFNELDSVMGAIEHIIMEVYQIVESVDV